MYAIECVDGRCYVGGTTTLRQRWNQHRSHLRRGIHANPPLQEAWSSLGEKAFAFVILELIPKRACLLEAEQRWIDAMRAERTLFNRAPTAGSALGTTHTAQTRAKISSARIGYFSDPAAREAMREANRRRFSDPAARARLSMAMMGVSAGEKNLSAKITETDVREIRRLAETGMLHREIAAQFGIHKSNVGHIVCRRTWGHVT